MTKKRQNFYFKAKKTAFQPIKINKTSLAIKF